MNIRIGRNTAGAAGASLMDMANFLRQGGQIQNAQAASRGNLVDQMAKRLLEQERQEKDAQADADRIAAERAKLDAKAKAEGKHLQWFIHRDKKQRMPFQAKPAAKKCPPDNG